MGSFTSPSAAPSLLKGVVVAGNIDIRGNEQRRRLDHRDRRRRGQHNARLLRPQRRRHKPHRHARRRLRPDRHPLQPVSRPCPMESTSRSMFCRMPTHMWKEPPLRTESETTARLAQVSEYRSIGASECRTPTLPHSHTPTRFFRLLKRNRGVGLIELLVALAISATLLTAVAVATDTSFKAYAINEEQATLTQRARLTTHRILTYIRTSKEHQPVSSAAISSFSTGHKVTDTGISMFTEDGKQLDFEFDAAGRRVLLTENGTPPRLARRCGGVSGDVRADAERHRDQNRRRLRPASPGDDPADHQDVWKSRRHQRGRRRADRHAQQLGHAATEHVVTIDGHRIKCAGTPGLSVLAKTRMLSATRRIRFFASTSDPAS